jgi:hypothetical protein
MEVADEFDLSACFNDGGPPFRFKPAQYSGWRQAGVTRC